MFFLSIGVVLVFIGVFGIFLLVLFGVLLLILVVVCFV